MTVPTPLPGSPPVPETPRRRPLLLIVPAWLVIGGSIVTTLAVVCAMVVLFELAFRRWAPWAADQGMGILVAWVWLYHAVAVVRRQRPIAGGLVRAFVIAGGTGVLLAAALYLVRA